MKAYIVSNSDYGTENIDGIYRSIALHSAQKAHICLKTLPQAHPKLGSKKQGRHSSIFGLRVWKVSNWITPFA